MTAMMVSSIVVLFSMFYLTAVCACRKVSMNGDISDLPLDMRAAVVLFVSGVIAFAVSMLYVIVTDPMVLL